VTEQNAGHVDQLGRRRAAIGDSPLAPLQFGTAEVEERFAPGDRGARRLALALRGLPMVSLGAAGADPGWVVEIARQRGL
jgi:hypothetical protein